MDRSLRLGFAFPPATDVTACQQTRREFLLGTIAGAGALLLTTNGVAQSNQQTRAYRKADLPPLLEFLDGTTVKTKEDWTRRKAEIRRLLVETFHGTYPQHVPAIVQAEVLQEQKKEDGSLHRQVRLTFDTKNKVSFEMWVWVPKGDGPFPVLLTAPRFYQIGWAEVALQRGYIVVLYPGLDHMHQEAAYPDYEKVWQRFRAEYPDATWTEFSTKAWLASRALDYLLDPKFGYRVAEDHVAVIGFSRYAKQSLTAAAFDDRITCVVARSAGSWAYRFSSHCEGGETCGYLPREWLLQSLRQYNGREHEMPIDSHGWLALIAPRRCLLHTAYNDDCDVTFAAERAYREGKKVYALLGRPENLCLDYRQGGHGPISDEHRRRNLDWIDLSFGRGAVRADAFPEPKLIHQFDWPAWKAQQAVDDLELPQTPASTGDRTEILARIGWMLGRAPDRIPSAVEEPFLTRPQEIEGFGEDRDPDRYASPDTARIPVVFGDGVRGNLYYGTKTHQPLPAVIWLHPYNWPMGYCSCYDAVIPWGQTAMRTPYHYVASRGFAVLAFDQVGFGTRLFEGRDFYQQYPRWSKLGRMVHDVRAAVDFVVDAKGRSQRELPTIDRKQIYLLGYSLGGMLALYSATLDERIAGVACFSGFTPLRTNTDAKPTGGIRPLWEWYALLPKLGLYNGREREIPYDYDDLLSLVAPRPCLIVSQARDRHANFADVVACVQRARKAWQAEGRTDALIHLTPDDLSHFQDAQHDMFLNWLVGLSVRKDQSMDNAGIHCVVSQVDGPSHHRLYRPGLNDCDNSVML